MAKLFTAEEIAARDHTFSYKRADASGPFPQKLETASKPAAASASSTNSAATSSSSALSAQKASTTAAPPMFQLSDRLVRTIWNGGSREAQAVSKTYSAESTPPSPEEILQMPDFEEMAAVRDPQATWLDRVSKYTPRETYRFINDYDDTRAKHKFDMYARKTIQPLVDSASPQMRRGYDQLTEEETKIYNYYYHTIGPKEAEDYLKTLPLTERMAAKDEEYWQDFANRHPIVANRISAFMGPFRTLGYLDNIKQYVIDGEIDPNSYWNQYARNHATIRRTISKKIAGENGNILRNIGAFGYEVGMSYTDSMVDLLISFLNPGVAAALMGSQAANSSVVEGKQRGLSDHQAFWYGTLTGAAEAILEKIPLDELFKFGKSATRGTFIAKQIGLEGGGEALTSLIDFAADLLINQDKSDYQLGVKSYEREGLTHKQAQKAAALDAVKQVGLSMLGGAITGGISGTLFSSGKGSLSNGRTPGDIADGPAGGDPDLFSSFLSGMDGRTPSSDSSLPNGADGGRIELEGGRTYGLQETEEFRGDGSGVYGETGWKGSAGEATDRGTDREVGGMETDVPEYDPGRTDRVASADEGEGSRTSGRRLSYLDHHGESSIAYEPVKKLLPDSPAGRAAQIMQDSGIRVVVTDGAFETGRGGQSVPHTEAVTAPDGTVYVSSAAQIPAERIAAHESVHVLQNQNSPLYEMYWDELQFQLDIRSKAYRDVAGTINDEHYRGRVDLDDPSNIEYISRELTAHLHEWLETDPAFAREIFGDLFFDWDAVVRANRALTEGMKASARTGTAGIVGKNGEEDKLFSSFLSGMEGRRFAPDSPTVDRRPHSAARARIREPVRGPSQNLRRPGPPDPPPSGAAFFAAVGPVAAAIFYIPYYIHPGLAG